MSIQFNPRFTLSRRIKKELQYIENANIKKPKNALKKALKDVSFYFCGLEELSPDKHELHGYLAAYKQVLAWADEKAPITEALIKKLHSLILCKKRATPYRKGQNGILDPTGQKVLYLPPKPKDVAPLMKSLVKWIATSPYPAPITAAIAHFGINSIHPYYDGNGRLARLITKLILRRAGCDLHGLLVLEDYYYKNLNGYYDALTISHASDYYAGAKQPITAWVEYFLEGYRYSVKRVMKKKAKG